MEKDLASFYRHNAGYNQVNFESMKQGIDAAQKFNPFEAHGFKYAINKNPGVRSLHIDIGSGNGWLISHTAPLFQKVIGIEPSAKAIEFSKAYNPSFSNVEYMNMDMVDALSGLKIDQPYFATTAAVFCHIKDYYVALALEFINKAPAGSVLLFCEPYDKNIQQPFWYIRSQEWWRQHLPNWDLEFLGLTKAGDGKKEKYKKSIYGICRGQASEVSVTKRGLLWKSYWLLSGQYYKLRYAAVRLVKSLLKIKPRDNDI